MPAGMGVVHVAIGLARVAVVDRHQFPAIARLGGDGHLLWCVGRDEPAAIQKIRMDFLFTGAIGHLRDRRWPGLYKAIHRLIHPNLHTIRIQRG